MALFDFITLGDTRVNLTTDPVEFTFLLIGTSNAGGTNGIAYAPYVGPSSTTNVWVCQKWVNSTDRAVFTANTPTPAWSRLTESMGMTPGTWGPEVTLGLELERIINKAAYGWNPLTDGAAAIRINIIKLAVSFGTLHADASNPLLEFNNRDDNASTPQNTAHKLLSTYYLKEYINEVRSRASGGCYFGGVFSVLGETDTLTAPYGTGSSHIDVEANMLSLRDLVLDRINITNAPWVASLPALDLPTDTRINATAGLIFNPTRIIGARQSLENIKDRIDYRKVFATVDPSDLQKTGHVGAKDGLHLTGSAQHEMGRRMAAAWHGLAKQNVIYRVQADLA